ncbi:MAG: tetratricopeptide repeat protein [Aminivibrio sp.]
MDKSLESWLRGEPGAAGGAPVTPRPDADQASLLGLPVAPLSSRLTELSSPDLTPSEQEIVIPVDAGPDGETEAEPEVRRETEREQEAELKLELTEEKKPDPKPALEEAVLFSASDQPVQTSGGGSVRHTPPKISAAVPRLFGEKRKTDRTGKGKKLAAAGFFTAAAIAAGAWIISGRETAGDLLAKGKELRSGGDYEGALEYYSRAAAKKPDLSEAYLGIAEALEGLGRKGEAVDAYYKCLQLDHENPVVHSKLGFLFLSMSSYENALRSFHESANYNPDNGLVFAGMGEAYEAREDYAQAVSAYRKALDIMPSDENRTALERVEKQLSRQNEEAEKRQRDILVKENVLNGRSALSLGDFEGSRNFFLKALDLLPGDHDVLMGMGDLNEAEGDHRAAADYYRAVLDFYPDSVLAARALAEVEKALTGPAGEDVSEELISGDVEVKGQTARENGEGSEKVEPSIDKKPSATAAASSDGIEKATGEPPSTPEKTAPAPLVPSGKGKVTSAVKPASAPKDSGRAVKPGRPATSAPAARQIASLPQAGAKKLPASGAERLERGDYPAAFSLFWNEMLTPAPDRPAGKPAAVAPVKNAPFSEGRWRDITPVQKGPLGGGLPLAVTLPGGGKTAPRWAEDKAALIEAIRINPEDQPVYVNLALSYLLQKEEEKKAGTVIKTEEEKAVWFSLLAHAWLKRGERDKAAIFLNAAKLRAEGNVQEQIASLEKLFAGRYRQ